MKLFQLLETLIPDLTKVLGAVKSGQLKTLVLVNTDSDEAIKIVKKSISNVKSIDLSKIGHVNDFFDALEKVKDAVVLLDVYEKLNPAYAALIKAAIDGTVSIKSLAKSGEFEFDGQLIIVTDKKENLDKSVISRSTFIEM